IYIVNHSTLHPWIEGWPGMPIPNRDELAREIKERVETAYSSASSRLAKRKEENLEKLKNKLEEAASEFKSKLES
ncbi:MAG: hypothetical protein GSR83_01440, partial [Desulfurococcales archaeon]|nr:hypothetical protein [Desulfurococcales archaeon]